MTEAELIQFCPFSLDSLSCKLKDKQSKSSHVSLVQNLRKLGDVFFRDLFCFRKEQNTGKVLAGKSYAARRDLVYDPLRLSLLSAMSSALKDSSELRRKTYSSSN